MLSLPAARPFLLLVVVGQIVSVAQIAKSADSPWEGASPLIIGRTDDGQPLTAWIDPNALDLAAPQPVAVVTASMKTASPSVLAGVRTALRAQGSEQLRAIAISVGESPSFPPQGPAYNTAGNRTGAAVWRGLAWLAPDVVVEIVAEDAPAAQVPLATQGVPPGARWPANSLAAVARVQAPAGVGTVLTARLPARLAALPIQQWSADDLRTTGMGAILDALQQRQSSPLRQAMQQRLKRTPVETAQQLEKVYGHDLKNVMYQPALALIARLQLGDAQQSAAAQQEIAGLLAPHLKMAADRAKAPMTPPKEVNGSAVAGHLIFADWAQRTGDPRARRLVELAVRPAFDDQGRPLPAMPSHHEMSDAVFMACPLLVAAGRLSGEPKYMQMAVRHFEFMQKLCIRADGLYRHSPLCEAAWGRGNGFPMLGLALSLTELAAILEARTSSAALRDSANAAMNVMRPALHRHALALLPHQDATGAWRQVIDEPSAYREFTATCMIGFALERGIRRGWLDSATFASAADRAWQAANARIGADGVLLDVCTGTGKQRTLQDYFDREAVLGRDERGGGMALIFAVERGRTSP